MQMMIRPNGEGVVKVFDFENNLKKKLELVIVGWTRTHINLFRVSLAKVGDSFFFCFVLGN